MKSASVVSASAKPAVKKKRWAQNDSFISLIENKHGFLQILFLRTF